MLRPMTYAPAACCHSSKTAWSSGNRSKCHSCRRIPPSPSGLSALCLGPATKPSSDVDRLQVLSSSRVQSISRRCAPGQPTCLVSGPTVPAVCRGLSRSSHWRPNVLAHVLEDVMHYRNAYPELIYGIAAEEVRLMEQARIADEERRARRAARRSRRGLRVWAVRKAL